MHVTKLLDFPDFFFIHSIWVSTGAAKKIRSSRPEVFCKKGVLRNFGKLIGKHLCQSLFFKKVEGQSLQLYLKKTLAQVSSYEFYEFSKNIFSYRTPLVAASEKCRNWFFFLIYIFIYIQPNAGKYGAENLRIQILFMQWKWVAKFYTV